jgi:disulfide bond formation protein DsbB
MSMDARLHQPSGLRAWTDMARARPIVAAALVVAVVGVATILGAWYFQYGLGLRPCPLCLEQRYPYYFAIPLAVMVLMGDTVGSRRRVLLAGLAVIAGLMLWNTGLAAYHAGVEWKWWPGPQTCGGGGGIDFSAGLDLRKELETMRVVRCDEAAWRFLGLSLAGYNVLISLTLAAVAAWGFVSGLRLPQERD